MDRHLQLTLEILTLTNFTSDITSDKIFPAHLFFNKDLINDNNQKKYMPFVKESENFGPHGMNPGHFHPPGSF